MSNNRQPTSTRPLAILAIGVITPFVSSLATGYAAALSYCSPNAAEECLTGTTIVFTFLGTFGGSISSFVGLALGILFFGGDEHPNRNMALGAIVGGILGGAVIPLILVRAR